VYDSQGLFAIGITNALNHETVTQYYGVNEDNANGSGLPGQVKGVRDANGLETWYEYDPFGRLRYTWLPGDAAWITAWRTGASRSSAGCATAATCRGRRAAACWRSASPTARPSTRPGPTRWR